MNKFKVGQVVGVQGRTELQGLLVVTAKYRPWYLLLYMGSEQHVMLYCDTQQSYCYLYVHD